MEQILGNEKQCSNRILARDDVHLSLCPSHPHLFLRPLVPRHRRIYLESARVYPFHRLSNGVQCQPCAHLSSSLPVLLLPGKVVTGKGLKYRWDP